MRLILILLSIRAWRLGAHELERAKVCQRWADEAQDRAYARLAEAEALGARAGLQP